MRDTERGRDIGRGRSRLPAENPMWDSIQGLWDHTLSQSRCSTTEPPRCPSSPPQTTTIISGNSQNILLHFLLFYKKELENARAEAQAKREEGRVSSG